MAPMYFEDFEVGQEFVSPARTITETDVVQFAQLSGDFNPVHTDYEMAKEGPFQVPIAHGLLGLSILTGLMARTGLFEGSVIALLGVEEWRFIGPIKFGDTIHVLIRIDSVRESKQGNRGIVIRTCQLINQRNETVQEGKLPVLVRSHKEKR